MYLNEIPLAAWFWVFMLDVILILITGCWIYEHFEQKFYRDATKLLDAADLDDSDIITALKRDVGTYKEFMNDTDDRKAV